MTRWAREDRVKNMIRDEEIIKMIDDVDTFSDFRYNKQLNKIKDLHIENYWHRYMLLIIKEDLH